LELRLDPAIDKVKADPSQLTQVVMNLALNARDAMPSGGTLTLTTANVVVDRGRQRDSMFPEPGRYVKLAIEDTGAGMDEETKSRIFEPFFTTKKLGEGTGLGLSTAYGIVKQSKGYLTLRSQPGRGTRFDVYLPASDG
jgi:signal transduction histidine kinase